MKIKRKYIEIAGIFVILILFLSMCQRNRYLKKNLNQTQDNIAVMHDSLETIKTKAGEYVTTILGYKANAKELKQFNEKLAKQVEHEKGKVITLNNLVFHLKQDKEQLRHYLDSLQNIINSNPPVQINDSTWVITWHLPYYYDKDNYDIFDGQTYVTLQGPLDYITQIKLKHDMTELINRDSKMTLTWGQKYDKKTKKIHVFAKTTHPAYQAELLEGTYVDYPKKKHWFTGFGIGPNFGFGYDFLHNQPNLFLGIGIQYNIYQW